MPNEVGEYRVTLTVSDFIGPGAPDTVVITVANADAYAEVQLADTSDVTSNLTEGEITTEGNQEALLRMYAQAVRAIQKGETETAIVKLQETIKRTDGCPLRDLPDTGDTEYARDWIIDCDAQAEMYALLTDALRALESDA